VKDDNAFIESDDEIEDDDESYVAEERGSLESEEDISDEDENEDEEKHDDSGAPETKKSFTVETTSPTLEAIQVAEGVSHHPRIRIAIIKSTR